MKDISGTLNPT